MKGLLNGAAGIQRNKLFSNQIWPVLDSSDISIDTNVLFRHTKWRHTNSTPEKCLSLVNLPLFEIAHGGGYVWGVKLLTLC